VVEIVTAETGILVPPGDDDAISRALLDLARNPARCAEMGRQARIRTRDFNIDDCVKGIDSVYRAVLRSRS